MRLARQNYLKVLVSGPYASGKTTFVRTLCRNVLLTEAYVSTEYERRVKPTTTVAFDYGKINVDGISVYLFGTPGQIRFNFMWKVLSVGMHGYIFIVDGSSVLELLRGRVMYEYLKSFGTYPHVVAVNKQDIASINIVDAAKILGVDRSLLVPLIAIDRDSAYRVLRIVVHRILDHLNRSESTIQVSQADS